MPLPKISHPIIEITVPSTKKKIKARMFSVKEEKILLIAKTSDSHSEIFRAIKQVVNNCVIDDDFEIDDIALFDLEYIFIKLRCVSVSNIAQVTFEDKSDGKIRNFDVDLTEIEVQFPKTTPNPIIKLTDSIGLKLKYPPASLYSDDEIFSENATYDDFIVKCIDCIYEDDEIYKLKNFSKKEITDFMESLSLKDYEKIKDFFIEIPHISHTIKYQNDNGEERSIELTKLTDFFIF